LCNKARDIAQWIITRIVREKKERREDGQCIADGIDLLGLRPSGSVRARSSGRRDQTAHELKQHREAVFLKCHNVAVKWSVLTLKGIREFFTDGIIHCWKSDITTWHPTTTSNIRFIRNLKTG